MCFDKKNWLANVMVFMSNHDDSLSNYNLFCTLSQSFGVVAFISE